MYGVLRIRLTRTRLARTGVSVKSQAYIFLAGKYWPKPVSRARIQFFLTNTTQHHFT